MNKDAIEAFLLDIQNDHRISRSMSEDEGDMHLHASRGIDHIIERLGQLEPARKEYLEAKRKVEEENLKKMGK